MKSEQLQKVARKKRAKAKELQNETDKSELQETEVEQRNPNRDPAEDTKNESDGWF